MYSSTRKLFWEKFIQVLLLLLMLGVRMGRVGVVVVLVMVFGVVLLMFVVVVVLLELPVASGGFSGSCSTGFPVLLFWSKR